MEPFVSFGIPRDTQALQASAREWSQILLQGLNPERVGHFEITQFSIGAFGVDEESLVAPEES
jgi:hypothetical protein